MRPHAQQLLYGDNDIGKTMIFDKFVRDHPNICNQFGEVEARKVLCLQMPSKPKDGRLYAQIIDGLGHKAPCTRRGTDLEILALRLLHRNPPRLMIVDDVHHLLAGSVREQRQSLNQHKFMSNELRMPVVALGIGEALYAMQADPQNCISIRAVRAAELARACAVGIRRELRAAASAAQAFAVRRPGDDSEAHGPQRRVDRQDHQPAGPSG